ncbi:STAS domain-containing protein [Streptomyces sp. NPDC046876]|uniref:STAS domain-containing protein n=1 Tax=Streptomyces sp. NPDC046876 TaxID=3155616 RepID=UPI0033E5FC55
MAEPSRHDTAFEARPAARALVTIEGLPRDRVTALVAGEVTEGTLTPLRRSLTTALESSAGGLDLDLSDVGFCDVAGLHMLLELRALAAARHRSLSVTAVSPPVLRLFRATGCAARLIGADPAAARSLFVTAELRRELARTGASWASGPGGPGDCLHICIDGETATVTWPAAVGDGGAQKALYEAVASALHRAGLRSVRYRTASTRRTPQAESVRAALFGPRALRRSRRV